MPKNENDIKASEKFNAKVKELMEQGLDKTTAVRRIVARFPDLHRALLNEANNNAAVVDEYFK